MYLRFRCIVPHNLGTLIAILIVLLAHLKRIIPVGILHNSHVWHHLITEYKYQSEWELIISTYQLIVDTSHTVFFNKDMLPIYREYYLALGLHSRTNAQLSISGLLLYLSVRAL